MQYERAPFFRRLLARVLDLLFSLALTFIVAIPVAVIAALLAPIVEPVIGRTIWFGILVSFCYFLAYVGLEVFHLVRREGQALGKGLMGLRVVPTKAPGDLQVLTAVVRMLIIFIPFVLASLAGGAPSSAALGALASLGFLSLFVSLVLALIPTARRQALHDFAAQTQVVKATKRKIEWRQDARMMVPGKIDMTKRL